ncbi:MAG: hypothetical protein AAB267_00680, partial [Candidatus Desantisbacteria bacterium]
RFEEVAIKDYPSSIPPVFSRLKAKKGTGGDYLKTLLPAVHIPIGLPYPKGAILVGQDAINENLYMVDFYEDNAFLFYQSSHFKTSILSFTITQEDEDSRQGVWWDYLLRQRISEPLSVWVGIGEMVKKKDAKKTRKTDVSTQFSLNFPKTKMGIYADAGYSSQERTSMKKINWQTLEAGMQLTQYTNDSQVNLMLSGMYQPDAPEKEELIIRGRANDDNSLKGNKLALISAEYTRPVLSINGGLWNPNIFLYDLCLVCFTEAGFAEGQKSQVSAGIELWQEFGGFLGYIKGAMAVIGVVETTKEKKNDLTGYLSIRFPTSKQAGMQPGQKKAEGRRQNSGFRMRIGN